MLRALKDPYWMTALLGLLAITVVFNINLTRLKIVGRKRNLMVMAGLISDGVGLFFGNAGNWLFLDLWSLPLAERMLRAGFTAYPGILGTLGAMALFLCIFWRDDAGKVMNASAPCAPLMMGIWRIGCSITGCCYGVPLERGIWGLSRWPTTQVEALFCLSLFLILQFLIKRNRLAVFFYAYAVFRLIVDFFRGDDRGAFIPGISLTPSQQIACLLIIAVTAALLLKAFSRCKTGKLRRIRA